MMVCFGWRSQLNLGAKHKSIPCLKSCVTASACPVAQLGQLGPRSSLASWWLADSCCSLGWQLCWSRCVNTHQASGAGCKKDHMYMHYHVTMTYSDILWHILTYNDRHIMTYCDILWHIMRYYDILWPIMTYCDILWHIMKYYDILWHIMTFHDILWHIMRYYEILWDMMTYDDILWHIMTYYDILWPIMTYCDILSDIMRYHEILWDIMTYDDLLWHTMT